MEVTVLQRTSHHPYSSVLRQRAHHLRDIAASLERALVTVLDEAAGPETWATRRARLCEQMLAHNLHQLHQAADDLRDLAFRFRQRADELDAAHRSGDAA
jgi:hypothetical protein